MEQQPLTPKAIFDRAHEITDADERRAYLDEACDGRIELRQQVEALLRAYEEAGSFLERPVLSAVTDDMTEPCLDAETPDQPPEGVGGRVGPYRLVEQIGEGGMGVVWLAEQTEPVHRRVAVKVIRAGLDSASVLARFEQERQALALMDHPNIARVLDAGATSAERGGGRRPYFVMELVKGIPITSYCDQKNLTIRERLELFIPVCQAVQHAHQKGVIHRDLKPSNVLVALYDGKPVPKIIDFGVAKAAGEKLTDRTLVTEVGQLVGTLEYMAPEQAELNNLDIDTRADVYSLGVLLYELLTGTPPFSRRQLRDAALIELLRMSREVEPPRPSARLSHCEDLPSIAARRKLEPKQLAKLVHGDLDWIVMKCLEKDRGRRYETAIGLAMDVQRYLTDEPVLAGPPSLRYKVRKLVHRNKGPVLAAALLLLALLGGIAGTSWGLLEARRQRDEADRQRQTAEEQRDRALKAEEKARDNAEKAKREEGRAKAGEDRARQSAAEERAVLTFFQDKILSAARPVDQDGGLGIKATIRAAVDAAEPKIAEAFKNQPGAEASIRNTLGLTYKYLGEYARAIRQYERVAALREARLGADHTDTLACRNNLANAYQSAGRIDDAIRLHEQTVRLTEAKIGADHPDTLICRNNLASAYQSAGRIDEALRLYEQVAPRLEAKLGGDHPTTLAARINLANVYEAVGRAAEAIGLHEQTLKQLEVKRGVGHPHTLACRSSLAHAYQAAGRPLHAIRLLNENLRLCEDKLGPEHPDTLACRNLLGNAYLSAGRPTQAVFLHERTLQLREAKLGPEHRDTLTSRNNLANAYRSVGRNLEAIRLYEQNLKLRETKLGPDHPQTFTALNNLANAYKAAGRIAEAIPLHEQALRLREAKLGADHPDTLASRNNLGIAYWSAHQFDRSIPLFEDALRRMKDKLGPDHPQTLRTMANLGVNYRDAGRLPEAIRLLEDTLQRGRERKGGLPVTLHWIFRELAQTYDQAGQFAKSEPLYRDFLDQSRNRYGEDHPATAAQMAALGHNLLRQHKYDEAEQLLRAGLKIQEAKQPDDWQTFHTRSLLGAALLGQKKYSDAEPRLLSGYQGMKERQDKVPPASKVHLAETLEDLVRLYEAAGKQDAADKWREELEQARKNNPTNNPDHDVQFKEAEGRLTITVPAWPHLLGVEGGLSNSPRVLFDVEGDFAAQARVGGDFRPATIAANGRRLSWLGAGLLLWVDDNTFLRLERAGWYGRKPFTLYVNWEARQNGKPKNPRHNYPGLSTAETYLRLERRGKQILASYSEDGRTWRQVTPLAIELPAKVKIGVLAGSSMGRVFAPTFDQFQIKRGQGEWVPVKTWLTPARRAAK
ncbi:MAG TPA: tetratricopeptide repeat protein [Gemmataceae bacterium]|nr:tetratricopeptide repeat protein [Gemmataceae bacterium]